MTVHIVTPDCGQGVTSLIATGRGEGTGSANQLLHGARGNDWRHGEVLGPRRQGAAPRCWSRVGLRKSPSLEWSFCHTCHLRVLTCDNFMSTLKLWKAGLREARRLAPGRTARTGQSQGGSHVPEAPEPEP